MESNQNIASKYLSSGAAGGAEDSKEPYQEDPFDLKSLENEGQTKPTVRSFKIKAIIVSKALQNFFTYTQDCQRYEGDIQELHQRWEQKLVLLKLRAIDIEEEGKHHKFKDLDKEINLLKKAMSKQDIFSELKDESYWKLLKEEVMANFHTCSSQTSPLKYTPAQLKPILDRLAFSSAEFDYFYWLQQGCQQPFRPVAELRLCMDSPGDMDVIKGLDKRLPDLEWLEIRNIPRESQEEARHCIAKYFPKKVRGFCFNIDSALGSIDLYYSALLAAAPCVTRLVGLYNFKISQPQTVALLAAFHKVTIFGFESCILQMPSVPSFPDSMENSIIRKLDFWSSGDSAHGDWRKDNLCFSNLMAGLAQVDAVRENLEKVWMHGCGMKKKEIKEILENCGLGHVDISIDW
ncbi:unnamed protein product [Moneuplotes crassus]|uniref:Uncharacterized protein n=1 Tax=Euplotes crassus TaxID=5936 RepID=A0AAD1ULN1_EUPCR|nr:unnamed protein product [Moneuplotes crassus]